MMSRAKMEHKGPAEVIEEVMARVAEANMARSNIVHSEWSNFQHTLDLMLKAIPIVETQGFQNDLMRSHMMRLMTFALRWVVENDAKSMHPNAVAIQKRTAAYVQQRVFEKMYFEEEEQEPT